MAVAAIEHGLHATGRARTRVRSRRAIFPDVPRAVPLIALVAAIVATIWSSSSGYLTLYGDARAHLDVARHVTDGITPGLAQLGTVWLPLPHLLMAPLVAVNWLWHSALAGSIVGGMSFVYSAVRLFSLGEEWLGSRRCAWVAFALYVTNLNILYIQTTALTEHVLLAFFVGAAYHRTRWTRTLSHRDLVLAAVMTACATVTRYDGWFVLGAGLVVVALWSWRNERRASGGEANVLIFATVGGFGIVLWLLYNVIIFHDPLAFIHSSFSAQSQQASLEQAGKLTTKGSAVQSVLTYSWAVLDTAGSALAALGLFGIGDVLAGAGRRRSRDVAVLVVLGAPVVFNILALWTGQSTLLVPNIAPGGMWNIRYGLMALPLLSLGGAALVRSGRMRARVVLAVGASGILLMSTTTPITLADGLTGTSSATAGRPELIANYLGKHYRGGAILADESSSAPLIFASGLDLSAFVTIGYHPYYENALAAPANNVEWVVMSAGDAIAEDMRLHPGRFRDYSVVLSDGRSRLLQRMAGGPSG